MDIMRILVVISGASGLEYGKRLVEEMKKMRIDMKVVVSSGAKKVAEAENTELPKADYQENDFSCPYASGSNPPDAVVIIPCSLKTLGEIANGVGNSLITRASEVALKERKKLILVVRETPYSLITIRNMESVTLAGGVILPATPGFYGKPKTVEDMIDFVVARVLDQLAIRHDLSKRWKG
ncbi:Flavin prenyltransferase UbiX [Candidatus Bilamarchaeum dharawalense]|uniref:Flavin prenyltransferase UbiX n=1 Tax=Candidatus Bilamarchaeum dharawalense TaxID=2885759 RepID=A0A5E4LQ78_9ARCH|nr:Flavin prenyltransferase UbiX [Candidatus Bilamarchaeum dharawalense]